MKFRVETVIFIGIITAMNLKENRHRSEEKLNINNSRSRSNPSLQRTKSMKFSMFNKEIRAQSCNRLTNNRFYFKAVFNVEDQIEVSLEKIEKSKNTIEILEFDKNSSDFIFKILKKCNECIHRPLKVKISGSKIDDKSLLSDIHQSLINLKISSLEIDDSILDKNLNKFIFNVLAETQNIDLLKISNSEIQLKDAKNICSIFKVRGISINDLVLFKNDIHTEPLKKLLGGMIDNKVVKKVEIRNNLPKSHIDSLILNILKASSTFPDLIYFEIPKDAKYIEKKRFELSLSEDQREITLRFTMAELETYNNLLSAILGNKKLKIRTIKFTEGMKASLLSSIGEIKPNLFEKIVHYKILIPTDGWLNEEQKKIIQKLAKDREEINEESSLNFIDERIEDDNELLSENNISNMTTEESNEIEIKAPIQKSIASKISKLATEMSISNIATEESNEIDSKAPIQKSIASKSSNIATEMSISDKSIANKIGNIATEESFTDITSQESNEIDCNVSSFDGSEEIEFAETEQ